MDNISINDRVGDTRILELPKTGFLCSRKVPAGVVLKCYDWAVEQRDAGRCVLSGFHSTIERDVFHYLLKGSQPIIIALHRGIGPEICKQFENEIASNRLIIISPFKRTKRRGSAQDAAIRNLLMIELSDKVVVGHASRDGELERILSKVRKPIQFLSS